MCGLGAHLWIVYFEEIRVFKAGAHRATGRRVSKRGDPALNTSAWDNRIGSFSYSVGFRGKGNDREG